MRYDREMRGPPPDHRFAPRRAALGRYDGQMRRPASRGYDGEMRGGYDAGYRRPDAYDAPYRGRRAYRDEDAFWMTEPSMLWDPLFGWAGMPPGAPFGPGLDDPYRARGPVPPRDSPAYGAGGDRALRGWARRYGHDFERTIRPRGHR